MTDTQTAEISHARLKSIIKRIEKLEEDRTAVAEDVRQVYSEAKGTDFDPKIIRKIIQLRKKGDDARHEEAMLLDFYASAIGTEV